MKNTLRLLGAILMVVLLQGCASVNMKPTTLATSVNTDKALVTFVRPSVFAGDGVGVDIWDGDHYLGGLTAGSIVQYETTPGDHLFLANTENWSYTKATLQAGKKYYIKANLFPGFLFARVALGVPKNDDKRIPVWLKLDPMAAVPAEIQVVQEKKRAEVEMVIQNFKDGKVKSFSTIGPEEGL